MTTKKKHPVSRKASQPAETRGAETPAEAGGRHDSSASGGLRILPYDRGAEGGPDPLSRAALALLRRGLDPVAVLEERENLELLWGELLGDAPDWKKVLSVVREHPGALAHPAVLRLVIATASAARWRSWKLAPGRSHLEEGDATDAGRRMDQLGRALLAGWELGFLEERLRIERAEEIERFLRADIAQETGSVAESLSRAATRFGFASGQALRQELARAGQLRKARALKVKKWLAWDMEQPDRSTHPPAPPARDRNASLSRAATRFGFASGQALENELRDALLRKRRKKQKK